MNEVPIGYALPMEIGQWWVRRLPGVEHSEGMARNVYRAFPAVEHVLGMLAAGDDVETILQRYPWLEHEDVQACLAYAHRLVGHERVEPRVA